MLALLSRIVCTIFIANLHAFHVSVCEIHHNEKAQSLEISIKIFIDDLQLSIKNQGNTAFDLSNIQNKDSTSIHLKNYIVDRFNIQINSKQIELKFVGYELKEYEILCYLEAKDIDIIETIEIENSLLMELFDNQINLNHFQYKNEMKSFKSTKEKKSAIIETTGW